MCRSHTGACARLAKPSCGTKRAHSCPTQATWREVVDAKWLRRFGGSAGDVVLTLKDGAKLEMRSVPGALTS